MPLAPRVLRLLSAAGAAYPGQSRRTISMTQRVLVSPAINDNAVALTGRLAAAGLEVVGADFQQVPLGIRSRHCGAHHQLPDSYPDDPENLLGLMRRIRPDAFLPVNTRATLAAVAALDNIAAVTAINLPSPDAFTAAYQKRTCMAECRSVGIPCPEEYSLR